MHNIWVACDWHLFNRTVEPRHPFRSTRNIGKLGDHYADMIQDDDLFIYLGDLCDPEVTDKEALTTIIKSIPGYKVLCMGNHDNQDIVYYYDIGFDKVCDVLRIHNLLFSHKPIRVAPDELNIHGHLHTEKLSSLDYQHINAYASNYNRDDQPILLDDLIDSAMIQDPNVVNDTKSLNQIREKFEKYTPIVSGEKYRDIYDLSDKISLSPVDESVKSTNDYVMRNLFFISKDGDYNETIVQPRIPDNYMTQNGFEDNKTPRVCFSTSIDGCLMGLSQNITNKEFYVYHPVGKHKVITPTEEQVPDVKIIKERWICEPVELTCIGKIKAIDVNGPHDDGIPYHYGKNKEHEARLYSWGYKWIEKFNESIQPSIVSLSASVEEEESVQKRRQRPIDEILFPDVDSTRYFEADDDAANKREDGAKYGDDRPVHKVIHKNDVVADGQANLDESSTPQILLKASSMTGKDKYLSIIAKDLFDEHARIVPELFEQEKLETIDTVKDLIAYFYKVTLPHSTMDIGGRQTENTILGAYLYRQTINSDTGLTEDDIKTFFGKNLTDGNVKVYVRQCIDRLNKVELAVCGLLIANLKMIRLSIDSVCCDILDPNARKDLIKRAKEYIDKNQDDFIKTESDGSVAFCYNDFGINHQVFISKEMYNNKAVKKNMRPSRFLARLGLYDYIIVAHGHTVSYENGKYKWNIEPITVEGRRFTDLDDLIRYLKETNVDARILVISCNEAHIIPDTTLYDHVDYADNEVLFESADLAIKMTGSVNSMLRDIVAMIPKKIKQLNKLEAQILSAVDNIDILVAPDVFEYVHIDDFNNFSVELKKVDVNGKLSKYRKCFGKAIKNIMEYYSMLLLRVLMSARKLLAIRTGTVNEGVYKLSIAKHKFQFSDMLCESSDDPYIYMPLFDEDGYQSIAECAHDVQLYQAAGGRLEDIQFSTALTESADTDFSALGVAISDRSGTTTISRDTSEVFFTKRITPSSLIDLFNCIYTSSDLPDHWRTMVKISTGEPGGHNYLKPELIGDLVKQINGIICDTVTAYDGNRDTKEKQLKTMKDHGFTRIGGVDVLDGDGELAIPVKDGYMLQNVNAGKDLLNFDFHVILSHFKGHQMAGYGGAIKNVAIGCASRRGKSQIHTYGSTSEMTVGFLDQYDQQSFLKAMVDAAKSFIDAMKIKGPVLYINVANNLSVDCDCIAQPEKPTMADIGIFASWDPVAVDSACIDAVYYAEDSQDLVERIESKDGTDILLYAEESGIGSRSYKLINIDRMNESSKVYNTTSDIGPMDREEKEKVAEKYGLRAVGQELPSKEEERRKTPEQRYEERNKKRNAALKKARKAKKRKAFVRKLKSHLPGVKNEDAELIRESNSVVDASDVSIPDGVEHSPLYGDKKDFFYNYDYPKDANAYAERMKLEESTQIIYINESSSENNLENVGELKVNGETLTIKRKVSENPNDPVSKLAHNLSFYLDDKKIANISISAVDSKKAFLYNFDVVSKYQGKGYGTAILKYVLSHYKVNELTVDKSNTRAIKLYKRFGFKTGVEFKENGKTRIDMKINLNETSTKVDNEDPLTKKELAEYGIRDLYTFQRWMKNNVRYKNMTNLMTPREVLEQKKGSCHDQVVLELAVLKTLGYHPTAYFVLEHDNKPSGSQGGETHSYVVVKDNGKQYWFENAWSRYAGLHVVTDPKFIKKMHEERSWGDSNKFSELEVVRFAGEPGDSLQDLVDHCFNDKQEINENSIRDTYQFELIEDVKFFDHLDESANKSKKLYPVYIMLVHSGTTVSNAIKFVSKSKFSHASISFDSSMDHMYSFARKDPGNPFLGGFRYESIGKGFYDKKEIPYALYVVPCTESQIKKMKKRLDYFIKNESKFQFDFAGLVKNYLGIADNPEYRWFCSRFVADILNAGAPKNKPYVAEPSLQDPDDFMWDEYATYVIGGDNLMKYNRVLVDKRTRKIIREEEMARSVKNESVIYDMDWNNPYAESVLNYQFSCMDESVVHDFMNYLKSYKLKFDNDGNIIIRRREYDQLDAHFRASVKLIKASEKAGDWETVKAELAKLYYMSGLIYEQCDRKQSKKSTPHVREDLMDLRSVILNVFQQHLKTVMSHDPKFNFNAYYETTKYSRDTMIPKAVLTSLGKTVITLLS